MKTIRIEVSRGRDPRGEWVRDVVRERLDGAAIMALEYKADDPVAKRLVALYDAAPALLELVKQELAWPDSSVRDWIATIEGDASMKGEGTP